MEILLLPIVLLLLVGFSGNLGSGYDGDER